ncbi:DUF971 domain-containing protein [Roseateles sp.]|uniref:DUF971 domain-containing protein n=1 Tax=Roseateles sp. TaxID=1971397 RepID=UPI0031E05383
MAGLDSNSPLPTDIVVHQQSKVLELAFSDGARFRIPFELMRVCSPSAEVQGHGPGQETLQTGKREVSIVAVQQVGHYALQPLFSDGHESGLFTWAYLYELGRDQDRLMREYEEKLAAAGLDRDAPMPDKGGKGGGHSHGGGGACASH